MATLTEVCTDNFNEVVLKAKVPVIVDFWATWCTSCKALLPKLEEISKEQDSKVLIVKVNAEDCEEVAANYSVRGLPTILFFKDGVLKNSLLGNQTKNTILEILSPLL
jgi:thioredoxin 1